MLKSDNFQQNKFHKPVISTHLHCYYIHTYTSTYYYYYYCLTNNQPINGALSAVE